MVHPGGRPREVTPPEDECIKLGKELVEWATKEDALRPRTRFAQFYSIEKNIPRKHWKAIIQVAEFLPYYEKAQALLADRCMDADSMEKSFGHRFLRLYERDLKEEEDETKRFEAELKNLSAEEKAELLVELVQYHQKDKNSA